MLARPRFGDDARLPEPLRQQRLAKRVVDLVGAGVGQVFPLEPDARSTAFAGQVLGEVQRSCPPNVMLEQLIEFGLERGVGPRFVVGSLEVFVRPNERLRDVPPAELAEPRR